MLLLHFEDPSRFKLMTMGMKCKLCHMVTACHDKFLTPADYELSDVYLVLNHVIPGTLKQALVPTYYMQAA